ncbi:hypothetical protein OHV05_37685 (plasmid) [Kitasatospora sp. NBC_00070]|uniref:hypothetical protein n=1 Tax=Kitasatospora sp. NBC_00070 TaxID=2975962 RepID=UPI002F91341F
MATDSAAEQSAPVDDQIQTLLLDARLSRNLTTVINSTALLHVLVDQERLMPIVDRVTTASPLYLGPAHLGR